MPLKENDPSDRVREENIKELIKAGHEPDQAVAIAYDIQRRASRPGGTQPASRKQSTQVEKK